MWMLVPARNACSKTMATNGHTERKRWGTRLGYFDSLIAYEPTPDASATAESDDGICAPSPQNAAASTDSSRDLTRVSIPRRQAVSMKRHESNVKKAIHNSDR
jgi:hypothetical protein